MLKLFFILLFPASLWGQKDFDYTLFTTRSTQIVADSVKSDTLYLNLYRGFEKKANTLKQINLGNTGNSTEYSLTFVGVSYETGCPVLTYQVTAIDGRPIDGYLFINPLLPTVVFIAGRNYFEFH